MPRHTKRHRKRSSKAAARARLRRSRNRRRKKAFRRVRSVIPRSVRPPRANMTDQLGFLPAKVTRTVYYCADLEVPGSAAPFNDFSLHQFRFSVNGLTNVDIRVLEPGEHQPRFFDQWMTFYNLYNVLGSKIKVTQIYNNDQASGAHVGMILGVGQLDNFLVAVGDAPTGSTFGIHTMLCERGVKTKIVAPMNNNNSNEQIPKITWTTSWTKKASLRRINALTRFGNTDPQSWLGDSGTNPVNPQNLGEHYDLIFYPHFKENNAPETKWRIEIAYKVEFSQKNLVSKS